MKTTTVLSNGIRVANFSSFHAFVFNDGSILPGVSEERSKRLVLERREHIDNPKEGQVWRNAIVKFLPSQEVIDELKSMEVDDLIDIVIVPFQILEWIRATGRVGKFRTCKADLISRVCAIDLFYR